MNLCAKVSIVIPTYNRSTKLNALLMSIIQNAPEIPYEVIVVDDSSRETTIDPNVKSGFGECLRVLRNKKRGFISKAKNLGWRASAGDLTFFIDDDNVIPKGTIETLSSKLDEDWKIGALMPLVYYNGRRNQVWVYAAPFSKGRWGFDLVGRNSFEKSKPTWELFHTDALPNASMIRRSILEKIDGLDEALPINSSCDLCQRIQRTGYGTFALSRASIFHDVSLPGTPGYWAEHAAQDSERRYYEVRDWFELMNRLHSNENLLVPKEFFNASRFLFAVSAGILLSPKRNQKILSAYYSMMKGLYAGMNSTKKASRKS